MPNNKHKIAVLPGDGIGEEVTTQAVKVLNAVASQENISIELNKACVGGTAYDQTSNPLPKETLELTKKSDAVLLGAVGGQKWESLDFSLRQERALLGLRKELGLFANLRPALVFDELIAASTLKEEVIKKVDLMVVRELTGGIYFGTPRGVSSKKESRTATNTLVYNEDEIKRIAKVAFEVAQKRKSKVCSVDKANVLETTELWRTIVNEVHKDYQDVELSHMYVDNAAMQLIRNPRQFDVIVTTNMFGDILSDEAAMLTGSLGMLPSASINESHIGLYEPVHGSAPDIAGQDKANPLATILSLAMMFAYSFDNKIAANRIEKAVRTTLSQDYRTADIYTNGMTEVGCEEMGNKVVENL